jgi:hypothetical protein
MADRVGRSIRLALVMAAIISAYLAGPVGQQPGTHSKAQGYVRTTVFREGERGYTGCADTRISAEHPYTNFGDKELVLGMRGRAGVLIRFDVSRLPSHAIVQQATLGLYVHNVGQRPD